MEWIRVCKVATFLVQLNINIFLLLLFIQACCRNRLFCWQSVMKQNFQPFIIGSPLCWQMNFDGFGNRDGDQIDFCVGASGFGAVGQVGGGEIIARFYWFTFVAYNISKLA